MSIVEHSTMTRQPATVQPADTVTTIRRGRPSDAYGIYTVFADALAGPGTTPDPRERARGWQGLQSLYDHLSATADQFWVAEREGRPIGYSRSILRDGVRELTEFFVAPAEQSSGIGHELLARAFPADGARHKIIIATQDVRAQALYLKAGVYPSFPIYEFSRTPGRVAVETDLTIASALDSPQTLAALGTLDRAIIGHRRDAEHAWLLHDRQGYLYYRDGRLVGYGYVGRRSGPFALLDATDFPAVLAHAETEAATQGYDLTINVPMVNRTAVDYLLARGYRISSFIVQFMSDVRLGAFETYIVTRPMFFL